MGECCKMFSGVLGKIKNFGWGLLNQTRRLPALPGGFARHADRAQPRGPTAGMPAATRGAARGWWTGAGDHPAPCRISGAGRGCATNY
jgi:hypothetical protein